MCLSFINRGSDTLIGMNFDNNGMKFNIKTNPDGFVVMVDGGQGSCPSFGVNHKGVFVNNLVVNSNGKGLYKRPSTKVTHTSKLVKDLLEETITSENFGEYLSRIEVVNTPNWSTHNMICDSQENVWIVEPGRGNLYYAATDSIFIVMSNFSLWDDQHEGHSDKCKRYEIVTKELSKANELSIEQAFKILELAKQSEGEWVTDFSMVYSKNRNTVYYCMNGHFDEIQKYEFTR